MTLFEDVQLAFAGRYRLESEIGEGGSAHVFAAQDLKHDRRVAIKILKTGVAQSIAADRFLREIRLSAGLHHPRILPLFDSGEVIGLPYFVMPFVEGSTLRARLQRDGALPVADAIRIATQVADALAYLHSRQVVHRDVKPENILLQGDNVWLADFGIVRALQGAVTVNRTLDGIAIGTPAYMSPEQRFAAPELDGQSDQYSLAVVVYEMLIGHTPRAAEKNGGIKTPSGNGFTPVHLLRADVPQGLDAVLARALQPVEADRWPSIRLFADKLADPSIITPEATRAKTLRRSPRTYIGLSLAGGLMLALAWWYANRLALPPLDPVKVAVLPLAHEGESPNGFLSGDDCSRFLRQAVRRWTRIRHVDDMQMRDVRKTLGSPQTVKEAMRMAKQLGAGMAVWGVVGPAPTSPNHSARSVHVYLYDVARSDSKDDATSIVSPADDLDHAFQQLADSLFAGSEGRPTTRAEGSRDYIAVRAYLDGQSALDTFNLSSAARSFRRAVELDPGYGLANLWLAWSTLWSPDGDRQEWGGAADRALKLGRGLTARDSMHARALVSMRDLRQDNACALYRSLIAGDSLDFAAWYGLGECLSSDVMVVASANSKSRWQFRASIHEAVRAYERALELVPSFRDALGQRAMQRVSRWLFAQTGRIRPGMSVDSTRFAAWPSLSGDTLAFIPFPERAVFAESAGTREPTYREALQRNRDRVIAWASRWVAADSSNPLAFETLALAREANDELNQLRRPEAGALTGLAAMLRARRLAAGETALRLAATHVRFLIKLDQIAQAKQLADSLLRVPVLDSASASTATYMQSLAMLTGRASLALAWGRRASAFQFSDPLHPEQSISAALSAAASDAATFAALGVAPDSIRSALRRFELALVGQAGPSVEHLRQLYVEQPLLYAWPALGSARVASRASAGNLFLPLQLALDSGDTTAARAGLVAVDARIALFGGDENAFELVLLGSRMWLALRDTTNATRWAGYAVEHVRTSGDQLIRRPTATAAFVGLLIQRSVLADQRGDTLAARQWGTRAWALWRDADPMIADVMRPILRWRNIPLSGGSR